MNADWHSSVVSTHKPVCKQRRGVASGHLTNIEHDVFEATHNLLVGHLYGVAAAHGDSELHCEALPTQFPSPQRTGLSDGH